MTFGRDEYAWNSLLFAVAIQGDPREFIERYLFDVAPLFRRAPWRLVLLYTFAVIIFIYIYTTAVIDLSP